jgi:hypothetical protein
LNGFRLLGLVNGCGLRFAFFRDKGQANLLSKRRVLEVFGVFTSRLLVRILYTASDLGDLRASQVSAKDLTESFDVDGFLIRMSFLLPIFLNMVFLPLLVVAESTLFSFSLLLPPAPAVMFAEDDVCLCLFSTPNDGST